MALTSFKRIFRQSLLNIRRQESVSVAAILILVITLTLIALLFVLRGLTLQTIHSLQDQIDVSVYFKEDVAEENIFATQDQPQKKTLREKKKKIIDAEGTRRV